MENLLKPSPWHECIIPKERTYGKWRCGVVPVNSATNWSFGFIIISERFSWHSNIRLGRATIFIERSHG